MKKPRKCHPWSPHLFSSVPSEELAVRAAEAGLDGYISKNDGIDSMVARVTELLTSRVSTSAPR